MFHGVIQKNNTGTVFFLRHGVQQIHNKSKELELAHISTQQLSTVHSFTHSSVVTSFSRLAVTIHASERRAASAGGGGGVVYITNDRSQLRSHVATKESSGRFACCCCKCAICRRNCAYSSTDDRVPRGSSQHPILHCTVSIHKLSAHATQSSLRFVSVFIQKSLTKLTFVKCTD